MAYENCRYNRTSQSLFYTFLFKFNNHFLKSHIFEFENNGRETKSLFKGDCKGCGETLKFKVKDNILERQSITFTLNGQNYTGKTFSKYFFI